MKEFAKLPYNNKVFFTCRRVYSRYADSYLKVVVIPQMLEKRFVTASHEPFGKNKYIDLARMINNL